MARYGLDYAWQHPSPAAMLAGGYTFACRYLSRDASKNLTHAEADTLIAAGIAVVCNWEYAPGAALKGRAQGVADATDAKAQAAACGQPADRPIYFSVDVDTNSSQYTAIDAYFDGAASVLGRTRLGVYGEYALCNHLLNAGKVQWTWQTYAWSSGAWETRANIRQIQNGITVGGADCDKNQAMTTDFGQWPLNGTVPAVKKTGGNEMFQVYVPGEPTIVLTDGVLVCDRHKSYEMLQSRQAIGELRLPITDAEMTWTLSLPQPEDLELGTATVAITQDQLNAAIAANVPAIAAALAAHLKVV
jgi:hypothetical protein